MSLHICSYEMQVFFTYSVMIFENILIYMYLITCLPRSLQFSILILHIFLILCTVPPQKLVRFLTSSPSVVKKMLRKAELMGIITQVYKHWCIV